jgi:membrane protein
MGWGSLTGAVLWIIASFIFSYYVANFGSFNKTYGSIGAVVILLMWFYVTAYAVLFAATADAQIREDQEARRQDESEVTASGK